METWRSVDPRQLLLLQGMWYFLLFVYLCKEIYLIFYLTVCIYDECSSSFRSQLWLQKKEALHDIITQKTAMKCMIKDYAVEIMTAVREVI